MKILLIGSDSRLARRFIATHGPTRTVARSAKGTANTVVSDYWKIPASAFVDIDTVINCVGTSSGNSETLHRVNVGVPLAAAVQARAAGCRQFIQLGSLSVYGRAEVIDRTTAVAPISAYGCSKAAADRGLLELGGLDFTVTIIRAPAIYGIGAAGKFGVLANLIRRTAICPVSRRLATRSVVHLDNAAAVLVRLCENKEYDSGIHFIQDRDSFDITTLAAAVSRAGHRKVRLVNLPEVAVEALKFVAPSLHASVFTNSRIAPEAALTTNMSLPVVLADGLFEMLAAEWQMR